MKVINEDNKTIIILDYPTEVLCLFKYPKDAVIIKSEKCIAFEEDCKRRYDEQRKREREIVNERYRQRTEELHDSYIMKMLLREGIDAKTVRKNPELIELTRLSMKTRRLLKQKQKI